ncbi:PREDICTED: chymotrypsin-2-like [Nicrophorus vespilloides]|uniref:Chymotrypsin-2-like n=1 Tax=Nicrophorus vespilloides TaxID=110193 RepID=A0ABM1M209_NICVS|nr:PREDICTED: chymotrypsin-2-like [Nicrophorus vespilloides]
MKSVLLLTALFVCVFAAPEKYIVGETAEIVEDKDFINYSYTVSVQWTNGNDEKYYHICGGAVIGKKHVLTAKHCCKDFVTDNLVVMAGTNDITVNDDTNDHLYKIIQILKEENVFPKAPLKDDLCVLELQKEIENDKNIRSIELCYDGITEDTGNLILSGWGVTDSSNEMSYTNLKVDRNLKILPRKIEDLSDDKTCDGRLNNMGIERKLEKENICTENKNGVTACKGDSGGPLVSNGKLIGIVTWGIVPCGVSIVPTIYTGIKDYKTYLEKYTKNPVTSK